MEQIVINSPEINLMQFLKWANVVASGSEVKFLVDEGLIKVNGQTECRYRRKLNPGDVVEVDNQITLMVVYDRQ